MDCTQGNGPPPDELRLAWACERWRTLPDAGGYYDQDFSLMTRMAAALNTYQALTRMYNLPGKRIHELTESERRVIRVLVDLGLIFNG